MGSIEEKIYHRRCWSPKYVITNFLDFKMAEDKEVTSQIHGFHMLINDLKNENINLPESFVVGCLIEKLLD